jgi:hypothetical protein
MTVLTRITADAARFGEGMEKNRREIVERLRAQAFALQRNFDVAEDSAFLLEEVYQAGDDSVEAAVDGTYEGNAVSLLRSQLFRLLIIELHAAVLDETRESGSVARMIKKLREPGTVPAIQTYYSDAAAFKAEIEGLDDPLLAEAASKAAIAETVAQNSSVTAEQWDRIRAESAILSGDDAKRITWARHNVIAHVKRTWGGLASLNDIPPYGDGPYRLDEPVRFLKRIKPFVYDVFDLVTLNRWRHGSVAAMHARAFWDRFKNGKTNVGPGTFKPYDPG